MPASASQRALAVAALLAAERAVRPAADLQLLEVRDAARLVTASAGYANHHARREMQDLAVVLALLAQHLEACAALRPEGAVRAIVAGQVPDLRDACYHAVKRARAAVHSVPRYAESAALESIR